MGDNNRGRKTPPLLPLLFLLTLSVSLSVSSSSSSDYQIQTQTLVVKPLTHPPSLEQLDWDQEQEEKSQTHSSDPTSADDDDDEHSLSFTLHHIDSLAANTTTTAKDLLSLRLERDALRAHSLSSLAARRNPRPPRGHGKSTGGLSSSVISGLSQGSGEYFTRLGIGTPPKYMYMVLDTGSDVVWIQCLPCRKCYAQTDPLFNPAHSSTFSAVPCSSPICRKLDQPGCFRRTRSCAYQVSYGDGSFTVGEFARDTVTFRRRRSVSRIALGCGHDNEGLFVGAAGLLGLGRGKLSFPTQLSRRFSYCLVDRTSITNNSNSKSKRRKTTSSVIFGDSSVSRTASYTPLLRNPKLDTFYYVELLGLSVGGAPVRGISGELFRLDAATGDGGVIIDSGTSVTRLTRPAYVALRDAFRAAAAGLGLKMAAEGFSLFDTCYDLSGMEVVRVPTLAMHFKGADVGLPGGNYLIPVDTDGKYCFAFAGTSGGLSIVGNLQQQGFRVVFDEVGGRVGFKPGACSYT